jgi:hypothetical protein
MMMVGDKESVTICLIDACFTNTAKDDEAVMRE